MKTLGILGGMGPYTSMMFYRSIIEISALRHGAMKNSDYPHLLISNLPVPDLIASRGSEEVTVRMVEDETKRLALAGAQIMVLACNTMHLFLDRFRAVSSVPFLSMIDAVVEAVTADGRAIVGLLGSATSLRSDLYTRPLADAGVRCIVPSLAEQDLLSALITANVAGNRNRQDERSVYSVIERLRDQGAQAVILGCTELPLVLEGGHSSLPVYDSLHLLAQAACREAYAGDNDSSHKSKEGAWRTAI